MFCIEPEASFLLRHSYLLLFDNPGNKSRSLVWKYFGFKKINDQGPATKDNLNLEAAICRLCRKEYANKGNTTNFANHLKASHPHAMDQNANIVHPEGKKRYIQQKLKSNKTLNGSLSKERVEKLNEALLKLLVGKVLPLSMVDNKYFKDFVQELDPRYDMPCRKTVADMLSKKKKVIEKEISEELSTCKDIAITHDGWTSMNTESFQTVTAHYITNNWELKSAVLQTSKTTGSHTGEAIAEVLQKTEKTWKFPRSPVATTDNAANEVKAFGILGWERLGCYGHRFNLAVKNSLDGKAIHHIVTKGRKLVTFFHQSSSANDLLKEKQELLNPNMPFHKLTQDVVTRWNSTLSMMKRLLEQTPAIMGMINDPKCTKSMTDAIKSFSYTFEEQSLAEKVINILEPFEIATTLLCSETTPTLPKVLPVVLKLKMGLKVQSDDVGAIKGLKESLQKEMEKRTTDTKFGLLGCILNPYTKDLQFLTEEEKSQAKDLLIQQITVLAGDVINISIKKEKIDDNNSQDTTPPLPALPQMPIPLPVQAANGMDDDKIDNKFSEAKPVTAFHDSVCKKMKFEDDWLSDVICVGESKISSTDMISQEVSNYLLAAKPDGISILDWWNKHSSLYPRLAILARRILCIPASSVPSERVFSLAGQVVDKKRCRLKPENVDMMIFLNKNMGFWK